ncbi:MAG: response regulator, partial [Coprobacter sp.]|nr:response regulator [Coprobacter sp.]
MNRILIVEDDITYRLILQTWLQKKGFGVETAGSIKEAQKTLETVHISLILSDLRLPDKDGISLLEWMTEKKQPVPLIIMTGYAEIQTAVQAMKLGAKD